jgi:hypothetical protein
MENHLTGSGLKAMDGIHCLVLYNLKTSVLSTTTQRMKLLSKYSTQKQHRKTKPLLKPCKKVVSLNGKTIGTNSLPE